MKSEIRDSQVRDLLEKVRKQNYFTYLRSMRMERIRGFHGARISFDFPVTALIGPNGSGKSTVLGACACVYSSISPENVFRKSRIGDDSMDGWTIEYELVEKTTNPTGTIRANVALKSNSWLRAHGFKRHVKQCSLNRTVPAVDNPLFSYKKRLSVHGKQGGRKVSISSAEVPNIDHIKRESERVLGRSLQEFKLYEVTFTSEYMSSLKKYHMVTESKEELWDGRIVITKRKIPGTPVAPEHWKKKKPIRATQFMYVGSIDGNTYSEFSFGSGESSVIRMVADIESLPDGSLVLIEEIENGLHPIAVRRMVEYLMDVADRKNIQSVFTTHSDYALAPLPSEAIWASYDGKLEQGKLPVEVLRAVSGRVDRRLAVFVEDDFSKAWVEAIVREHLGSHLDEIGIYPVCGDSNAVKTHLSHRANPAVPFHSVCFIDGDSSQTEDPAAGIYRLPGTAPELTVFNAVTANLDQNIALLTANCQRPVSKQDEMSKAIKMVSSTNRDPHLLFAQAGEKAGFIPEAIVRGAFLSRWLEENSASSAQIAAAIQNALDLPPKST